MVEEDRVCREQGHRGQRDATGDCGGSQRLESRGGGILGLRALEG